MVFSTFVKQAKYLEKLQFFQSAYPYLNSNSLAPFQTSHAGHWNDEPHPSNASNRFLKIDSGHYGLYYTIFSHDGERKQKSQKESPSDDRNELPVVENLSFFISKINQDILHHINYLRAVSDNLARPVVQVRQMHRSARDAAVDAVDQMERETDRKVESLDREKPTNTTTNSTNTAADSAADSDSFLVSLTRTIESLSALGIPSDLNSIYPIYQSLKRNDLVLPSINTYNLVLSSISARSLDSEPTLEAIEARLTTLLTVYQDILVAGSNHHHLKPNSETYTLVLEGIFKGSIDVVKLANFTRVPQHVYNASFVKSQEYCKLGVNLLMSLQNPQLLQLKLLMTDLVTVLNIHPNLLSPEVLEMVCQPLDVADGQYYVGMIGLARFFEGSPKERYDFVAKLYDSYKLQVRSGAISTAMDFEVYAVLIQTLVQTENFALATQFLDSVLTDFKVNTSTKAQVSNLISVYLDALMASGSPGDINKSYRLLQKFNEILYLPDASPRLYNEMVNNFIKLYAQDQNPAYYNTMWKLYGRVAARKDFQNPAPANITSLVLNSSNIPCRDFLLSLSVDMGDHEKVFQLLREILAKDHLIYDANVLKKVCSYLYHGAKNNNLKYYDMMWSLLELQANYHQAHINTFVSDMAPFFMLSQPVLSHNVDLILNSLMVHSAFRSFNLATDNIYGVMTVARVLMLLAETRAQMFKTLQYMSYLLVQFEDTENHYLELGQEVSEFKTQLNTFFTENISSTEKYSSDMIEACRCLGIEVLSGVSVKEVDSDHNIDLSFVLTANYDVGIEKFIRLFHKGHKFNEQTWTIVINNSFLTEKKVNIDDFVHRIVSLNLSPQSQSALLIQLCNYRIDKVLIHVLKYALKNPQIINSDLVNSWVTHLWRSENIYFQQLFVDNLLVFASAVPERPWLSYFFTCLGKKDPRTVISILESNQSLLYGLNLRKLEDQEYLAAVCRVLVQEQHDLFNEVFSYYKSPDFIKSPILQEVLLGSYVMNGSFQEGVDVFAGIARTTQVEELYKFCQLMNTLQNGKVSLNTEAKLLLLIDPKPDHFQAHQKSILSSKEAFINAALRTYVMAAKLQNKLQLPHDTLTKVFFAFIKGLRAINVNKITSDNMVNIVRFLSATKAGGLMTVIVNKLVDFETNQLSPVINFFFLETVFPSTSEGLKVLKELKIGFDHINDGINTAMIDEFAAANSINL